MAIAREVTGDRLSCPLDGDVDVDRCLTCPWLDELVVETGMSVMCSAPRRIPPSIPSQDPLLPSLSVGAG